MKTIAPSSEPSGVRGALALAASLALMAGSVSAADATERWTKHCASCHGKDGKSETKAGKKAGVKDQTDSKYQASLTDAKMFESVKQGLKEDSKETMRPFSDKLTDEEIQALVAHVRSFKK
jgi:cytochrome c553